MKKFVLLAVFCISVFLSVAQEKDRNILLKEIPVNLKIDDKIVVENASPYLIQQIVVALPTNDGFKPLCSLSNIEPGGDKDIDVDNEKLMKSLRGKTIAIKVKGLKYLMKDIDDASEALKSNDNLAAVYDFDVTLSAHRGDLVISVLYKGEQGKSVMDF